MILPGLSSGSYFLEWHVGIDRVLSLCDACDEVDDWKIWVNRGDILAQQACLLTIRLEENLATLKNKI